MGDPTWSGKLSRPPIFFDGGSGVREDGYHPQGLEEEAGDRVLVINGWVLGIGWGILPTR